MTQDYSERAKTETAVKLLQEFFHEISYVVACYLAKTSGRVQTNVPAAEVRNFIASADLEKLDPVWVLHANEKWFNINDTIPNQRVLKWTDFDKCQGWRFYYGNIPCLNAFTIIESARGLKREVFGQGR